MARVILDIPSEKMQSFIQLIVKLGIEKHAISSKPTSVEKFKKNSTQKKLHLFTHQFLLFDWEFFSNELEFE